MPLRGVNFVRRLGVSIESRLTPEAVPFAAHDAAERFVTEHGGRIVALTDVPESYIFAYADEADATMPEHGDNQ